MTHSGSFRRWDPFQSVELLATLWNTTPGSPLGSPTATGYRSLFTTLRRLVVGRRLTVGLDVGQTSLTITEFESNLDIRALSVGQFNDVRLAAREIDWGGRRFEAATAVLRNVHIRPAALPTLVAAPVELTVDLSQAVLDDLIGGTGQRWSADIGPDGVPRLALARRPGMGHLEVDLGVDGLAVVVKPRRLTALRRTWRLPARTPAYRLQIPTLPGELELTDVAVAPGMVRLTGRLPEWRMDLPRGRLEELINQLNGASRSLNLTRFLPGSTRGG